VLLKVELCPQAQVNSVRLLPLPGDP